MSSKAYKLSYIAKYIGASLDGDDIEISSMKSLASASDKDISFFYSNKFKEDLSKTNAGAVITDTVNSKYFKGNKLIIDNVHLAYAKATELFAESTFYLKKGLSKEAFINKEAVISDDVYVGPGCAIEKNVEIGKGSILLPNVTILSNVSIGENCIIHSGTVIGSDGLGFAKDENDKWKKINHLGKVVINNDVEIGSNCTIDRGTLDDTIIGENVKLDDQVHIAHNCKIGKSTIMGANATIGGSTIIGENCMIGGLCGVADNLVITDGVTVSPVSFIFKSINKAGKYSGSAPLMPRGEWLKASATYKKLSKKRLMIEKQDIKRYLPHREPFLFVDGVTEIIKDEYIKGFKEVKEDEYYFKGHFPDNPILPGVIIIEALAQVSGILGFVTMNKTPEEGSIYYFVGADNVRFRSPVVPPSILTLESKKIQDRRGIWKFDCKASLEENLVCSATILCADRPK